MDDFRFYVPPSEAIRRFERPADVDIRWITSALGEPSISREAPTTNIRHRVETQLGSGGPLAPLPLREPR